MLSVRWQLLRRVNQIVRSIAVIRDPIVRASYLRECAHRTDVREDTLIAQMNRFIYQGKEARQREEERAQASQASQPQPFAPASPMQQASKVEKMLIETVIRHGGEVILPDVEDETSGQHFDLNVAQYIAYDLAHLDRGFFINENQSAPIYIFPLLNARRNRYSYRLFFSMKWAEIVIVHRR